MNYEIGQLYHCSIQGLICITHLDNAYIFNVPALPANKFSLYNRIGRYVRLANNQEYSLTDRKQCSIATDADIIEFITNKMLYFKISDRASIAFYKDCNFIHVGDSDNDIILYRDDIAAIIELLQREVNL